MGIENFGQSNQSKESLESFKERAGAWRERYYQSLDELFAKENPTQDELVDIIWEKGILDRITPQDPEEKMALKKLHKQVCEESRDDPRLYWRILYSAWRVLFAIKNNLDHLGSSRSLCSGALEGVNLATHPEKADVEKIFPYYFKDRSIDPNRIIIERIVQRAKKEIENRGHKPHVEPIPMDSNGSWRGIKFTVGRIAEGGMIPPLFFDSKEMGKIPEKEFRRIIEYGFYPDELDPKDFTLPKNE